jgi:hypothetical protein
MQPPPDTRVNHPLERLDVWRGEWSLSATQNYLVGPQLQAGNLAICEHGKDREKRLDKRLVILYILY